jgi:biopolymer transport protein ExbD
MNFRSKNKINPEFSMSSMTDIIFLLLIFFMLTSNFVTPSGLPVNLPSSKSSTIVMQKISVTITPDLKYFVNDKPVAFENIEPEQQNLLSGTAQDEGVVVLHVDKSVPVEHLVKVAGIATELKAKVTLATLPTE